MPPQIKQAKLETLEAIIKEVEGMGRYGGLPTDYGCNTNEEVDQYNFALSDLLTKLRTEKEKLIEKEKCVPDGLSYMSNPPQLKCKNCGQFWFAKDETPTCRHTQQPNDWEKQLAEIWRKGEIRGYDTYDPIKSFIKDLLKREREATRDACYEDIKKILRNH